MPEPTETSDLPLPGMEEYTPAPPEYGGLLTEPKGSAVFELEDPEESRAASVNFVYNRREALDIAQRALWVVADIGELTQAADAVLTWLTTPSKQEEKK